MRACLEGRSPQPTTGEPTERSAQALDELFSEQSTRRTQIWLKGWVGATT